MKWVVQILTMVALGCSPPMSGAEAFAQVSNPAAQALKNEQKPSPLGGIAGVIREADQKATTAALGGSGGLDLGMPGASPPPVKRCLKLDPDSGFGPDVISNFNFPDADIVEIAETLGRLTCLNFIFDKDVKGRISIINNSKITVGDAWKAFLTALDMSGFSIIPSGQFLRIARERDAKDKQIKTYSGNYNPNTDEYITRILPLKYISAQEVATMLRNFMPPNSRVLSYEQTNTLIITDTGANVNKLVEMIEHLDVARFDERITVIPIIYASAVEIARMVQDLILNGGAGAPGMPIGIPGMNRLPSMGLSGVSKTKSGAQISHVLADERTNSIVIAANAEGTNDVRQLVQKLDYRVAGNANGNHIRVIYLQYADAEQLAQTIMSIVGNAQQRPAAAPGGTNLPPTAAAPFEGTIKVSPDKPTNALLITGTQSDFATMSQVVAKLDVPRDQVYVEAVIMEMTVNKEFDFGVSVANPSSGIAFLPNTDLASALTNPLSLTGLVVGFQGGSGSANITIPGTNQTVQVKTVQGLIRALQQHTNSDILATPQLLTLDNQEASIEIAENIPVPTSTAIQGAGVATSITREKVALSLKIKPQINKASDFVKLDIDQKLEDIENRTLPSAVQNLAFATTSRSSKTTVVVQNGDTVALGGLVRNTIVETTTKVPILGDIPLIGWLFRARTNTALKQNLLAFITPRVIKQYRNIRTILDHKIRERDDFLEENRGGIDPFEGDKRNLIRSLPPVADLKDNGRVESGEMGKPEQPRQANGRRQPAGARIEDAEQPPGIVIPPHP